MSTTNSLAKDRRDEENAAAKANAQELSVSDKIDVSYGKWVEVVYEGSMQKVYEKFQQGDTNIPFSNMIVGGTDTNYTDYGSVQLENNDDIAFARTSGFFKCVLRDGWMTTIDVRTENEDYFYDNIKGPTERSMLDFGDSPKGSWDEQISFTFMKGGDYLSIDIDNESTDVGQFSVVVDGTKYHVDTPYNMDNEAKVWLEKVWYFVESWGTITYEGEDREGGDKVDDDDDIIKDDEDGEGGDGDGDGDGEGGDETPLEDVSIFLIFGAVALVIAGAFYFLRGE